MHGVARLKMENRRYAFIGHALIMTMTMMMTMTTMMTERDDGTPFEKN